MRWLLVISSLEATDGGPPQAVLSLTQALAEMGHEPTILAHRYRDGSPHASISEALSRGVKIHWVDRRRPTRFQFSPRLTLAARRLARDADVITAHGFYQWTCVAAYLAARRGSQPLMLQPHGVFEPYQEGTSSRTKQTFRFLIGRRVLRRAAAIVAASDSEADGFHSTLGTKCPDVLIAGLGVPAGNLVAGHHDFSSRRVLFLSRVAEKKRLDKLIDAAALLRERGEPISLSICGDGSPDFVARLKARVPEDLQITWHGLVRDPERADIESRCALMCLPSDNENFGQSVTESMARGLPVVTTTATGAATHVRAADAGWVLDNPTVTALADCLSEAVDAPSRLNSMSSAAAQYARRELSWRAVARRWVDFAESVAP
jgi:glycosyltransferase involved in cell wall biosynthesis